MSGNRAGGRKAAAKNKAYNPNFYVINGRAGGKISRGGGFSFTGDPEVDAERLALASVAGRKGGKISRRHMPTIQEY